MTISLAQTVSRSDEQVSADLDGEVVLMSIEEGKYFNLDAVGSAIWEKIEQPITVSDLIEQLTLEFDVTQDQATADVLPFLDQLHESKLIVVE